MSRSKAKHKAERKRRHERQIAEGTRAPKQSTKKGPVIGKRAVLLSSLNKADVQAVFDFVRDLDLIGGVW